MLAGMGISGWKKNYKTVTGKPDATFPKRQIAIFVDGCFWHHCPVCQRQLPVSNREYWTKTIQRNVARDRLVDAELKAAGWKVVRIWEHELQNKRLRKLARERVRRVLEKGSY